MLTKQRLNGGSISARTAKQVTPRVVKNVRIQPSARSVVVRADVVEKTETTAVTVVEGAPTEPTVAAAQPDAVTMQSRNVSTPVVTEVAREPTPAKAEEPAPAPVKAEEPAPKPAMSRPSTVKVAIAPPASEPQPEPVVEADEPVAVATASTSGTTSVTQKKSGSLLAYGTKVIERFLRPEATAVFVAGALGQTTISVIRDILKSGYQVVAGVDDLEEGQRVLDLMKKYELISRQAAKDIKLVEANFEDEEELNKLPKKCRLLVVEGDSYGGTRKTGADYVARVAAAAKTLQSPSIILVSTSTPPKPGFSFFSFGAKPKNVPTAAEQAVMNCGVKYSIMRVANMDKADEEATPFVSVKPFGRLEGAAPASKAQAAAVLAQLLVQPNTENVFLEVGATEESENDMDTAACVADALLTISQEKMDSPEEEEESPAPVQQSRGLFGTRSLRPKEEAKEEEEEEKAAPTPAPKKSGTGFSFGFMAKKQAPVEEKEEEEEEEEEEPAPAPAPKKSGTGFFGFGRQEAVQVEEQEEKPKTKAGTMTLKRRE